MSKPRRYHVIRDGEECFVLDEGLTAQERDEIAERRSSPQARRRFAAKIRWISRREKEMLQRVLLELARTNNGKGEKTT